MDGIEITKVIGTFLCFIGAISAVILFFKSLSNSFTEDSLIILVIITAGGIIAGVLTTNSPKAALSLGIYSLILSGISVVCLLAKAASNKVSNDGAIVLFFITFIGFIVGLVLIKGMAPNMPFSFS